MVPEHLVVDYDYARPSASGDVALVACARLPEGPPAAVSGERHGGRWIVARGGIAPRLRREHMANSITEDRNAANFVNEAMPFPDRATVIRQTVAVDDIRVEAFIGVHGHEKNRRQSLIVAVQLDIAAPVHDAIADTVDYNKIVDSCRELADRGIGLIETFARLLGRELLADRRVLRAEVSVTKPGALPNGVARTTASLIRSPPLP